MKLLELPKGILKPDKPLYSYIFMFYAGKNGAGCYGRGWVHCREQFLRWLTNRRNKSFFFITTDVFASIRRIKYFESGLDINRCAVFYKTDNPNLIYVRPGKYWTDNNLRLAIFSALLKQKRSHYFGDVAGRYLLKHFKDGYDKLKAGVVKKDCICGDTILDDMFSIGRVDEITRK